MSFSGDEKRSITPISAAIVNASTQPIPGDAQEQRDVGVVGVTFAEPAVDLSNLALEVVNQRD